MKSNVDKINDVNPINLISIDENLNTNEDY